MKVLDTSVAVDHLRGHSPATEYLRGVVESGEELVAIEIVRFELVAGVRDESRAELEAFFEIPIWLPIHDEIAVRAGELARTFRKSHGGIDTADYLIAAAVELLDAELMTTNLRHFPMVEGLETPY